MNYQSQLTIYLNKIYNKKIENILQKENIDKLMELSIDEIKSLIKSQEIFLGSDLNNFIINLIPSGFDGYLLRKSISKEHNVVYPVLFNENGEEVKNYTHNNFALSLWYDFTNESFINDLNDKFNKNDFNVYVDENLNIIYDELLSKIKLAKSKNTILIPYNENNLVSTVKEMILNNTLSYSYALSLVDMDALRDEMENASIDLSYYDEFGKLEDDLDECVNKYFKYNDEELFDFLVNKEDFILQDNNLIKVI